MTKKIRKILEYPFRVVETPITIDPDQIGVDQRKLWRRRMIIFISAFLVAFLYTLLRH